MGHWAEKHWALGIANWELLIAFQEIGTYAQLLNVGCW